MRFRPRNVRSRLTLWYVLVLAGLLALYAAVASSFLFLSLREDFDHNLLQDLDTVEGMLEKEPNGHVSLHASHPDIGEPRIGHFIEVWSPRGSLLYRSAALQAQRRDCTTQLLPLSGCRMAPEPDWLAASIT